MVSFFEDQTTSFTSAFELEGSGFEFRSEERELHWGVQCADLYTLSQLSRHQHGTIAQKKILGSEIFLRLYARAHIGVGQLFLERVRGCGGER